MIKHLLFLITLLVITKIQCQPPTLEDLWLGYKYFPKSGPEITFTNNSDIILESLPKHGLLVSKDLISNITKDTLVNLYTKVSDIKYHEASKKYFAIKDQSRQYRRSASYNVHITSNDSLIKINDKKASEANYSPKGNYISYVSDNNIYIYNYYTKRSRAITNDGEKNAIINGHTDWVYEEEFAFTKAYAWSPDESFICYLKFNESEVPIYNMQIWDTLYPQDYLYKYPKAGKKNSKVTLHLYNLETGVTKDITPKSSFEYIPRIGWTPDGKEIFIQTLNRQQNDFNIFHYNIETKSHNIIYSELNDTYVDVHDDFFYIKNKLFMKSSRSGYQHIYEIDILKQSNTQITSGEWDVKEIKFVNDSNIYFTASKLSPLEQHVFKINLNGTNLTKITKETGWHDAKVSPDGKYFIDNFSSTSLPFQTILRNTAGETVKVLESNNTLISKLEELKLSKKEFFSFKGPSGDSLNGWMIKPHQFKKNRKHPVLMYVYGGPGYQTVKNEWSYFNFLYYQILASKGYIIVSVDGRGTGSRGKDFLHSTYGNLGKYELEDQIAAAEFLKTLKYADPNRIGIWGWSFGGYLSSLAMTKGAGVFSMGIAVAPVTSWRFYDTIYTERYLNTPQKNPKGYDENSPIQYVTRLKGDYLLIHGTGDDNVHVQNAIEMQNSLIKANKSFDIFYYPNRAHGISGGNTRYHLYKMMLNYTLEKL